MLYVYFITKNYRKPINCMWHDGSCRYEKNNLEMIKLFKPNAKGTKNCLSTKLQQQVSKNSAVCCNNHRLTGYKAESLLSKAPKRSLWYSLMYRLQLGMYGKCWGQQVRTRAGITSSQVEYACLCGSYPLQQPESSQLALGHPAGGEYTWQPIENFHSQTCLTCV